METAIDPPGGTEVPTAGRLVVLNGDAGGVTPVMVVGVVPVLLMLTVRLRPAPVGTVPKSSGVGSAASPSAVPRPCRSKAAAPVLVVKLRAALAGPGVAGLNETGRVI